VRRASVTNSPPSFIEWIPSLRQVIVRLGLV
jgi:hypothetical protein